MLMLKQKNIHVVLSLLAVICFFLLYAIPHIQEKSDVIKEKKIVYDLKKDMPSSSHTAWQSMHDINSDFIGWLSFDNNLLALPVVQTSDNQKYLHTDFLGKENSCGTVFMDQQDRLYDQGILLYGHNVFYDQTSMFSPLTTLTDQNTYENNRFFSILLENEIRSYEITHVMRYNIQTHAFDQRCSHFEEPDSFEKWIAYADKTNCIKPFQTLHEKDNFCILQTCVRDNKDIRLLVIAKEIKRKSI